METSDLNINNGCSHETGLILAVNPSSGHSEKVNLTQDDVYLSQVSTQDVVCTSQCAVVSRNSEEQIASPINTSENNTSSKDSTALTIDISTHGKSPLSDEINNMAVNSGHQGQDGDLDQSSSVSVSFLSSETTSAVPETPDGSTGETGDSVLSSTSDDNGSYDKVRELAEQSVVRKEEPNSNQSMVVETFNKLHQQVSLEEKAKENKENGHNAQNTNPNVESNINTAAEHQNGHLLDQNGNDALQGRDEDSLVAARLMTNLARGSLPFPPLGEKDLTELQVTSNNALNNESSHVMDTQAVLYNEQLLNAADPLGYPRQEGFQTFNGGLGNATLMSVHLPSFNQGYAPLPVDAIGPSFGPWNQSDMRIGHPQASSTPQESRSDSSLNWDPNHVTQSFPSPFPPDVNQGWNNFPGSVHDNRQLHPDANYENLLPPLHSVASRNPAGLLFNPNEFAGPGYFAATGPGNARLPLPQTRQFPEQDPLNYGPLDYRMMQNGPHFFPLSSGPGNIPLELDYLPRHPHRDISDVEQAYRPKHKQPCTSAYDMETGQSPIKRRRRSRYSRKTAELKSGYPELSKSLFSLESRTSELLEATKNLQKQNDLYNKQERYFVIISPEVNPADVKSINHKGLLAKYIDYLIVENEQITEMSKSVSIPVDNYIADDPYLSDIIKVKVPFPSAKYLHWLKTYYPNIQVDWKRLNQIYQHSGGDFAGSRTFFVDHRPMPVLLKEAFFFFQNEKNNKKQLVPSM